MVIRNNLIEDNVLMRVNDLEDKRRYQIVLNEKFLSKLKDHVNNSINMIEQIA